MEQIIVCISSVVTYEESFLVKCGRSDDGKWIYASTNGVDFQLNQLCNNYNFLLINPIYLFTDQILPVTNALREKKNIVVWNHISDKIKPLDIKNKAKIPYIKCNNFHHGQNRAIENFLKSMSS